MSDRRERTYEQSRPGAWRCPVCGATVPDELVLASLPPKHEHADRSCLSRYVFEEVRRLPGSKRRRTTAIRRPHPEVLKQAARHPGMRACDHAWSVLPPPAAVPPTVARERRCHRGRGGCSRGSGCLGGGRDPTGRCVAPSRGWLLLVVVGCLAYARHWARLAGRSRVGVRSEGEVRRALSILRSEVGRCGTRSAGRDAAISTASRSRPPAPRSRSRSKPKRSTEGISPRRARWRSGLNVAGEGIVAAPPYRSCLSSARARWSGSRTGC